MSQNESKVRLDLCHGLRQDGCSLCLRLFQERIDTALEGYGGAREEDAVRDAILDDGDLSLILAGS